MILRYFLIYLRSRIISALFLQYLLQHIRCHKYILDSILIQALCNLIRSVSPLLCVCLIQYNNILCLLWTAFSPALFMTGKLYQVLFCHLIFRLFSKKLLSMETKFDGVITPLKIDISTGDVITPAAAQDQIFASYIAFELPVGITGLLLAAIYAAAQSTLYSAI